MVESLVHAVGDRAIVIQGGKDLVQGIHEVIDAANVEKCLLLPGE